MAGKEDEYKHQEEDYGAGTEQQPMAQPQMASRPSVLSRIFNKRLLIVIVGIIAIAVIYQFFLAETKNEDNIAKQMAANEATSAKSTSAIKQDSTLTVPKLQSQITTPKIETRPTFNQQDINRTASMTSQNQIALQQLQQNQARVDRSLAGIERKLDNLSTELSMVANRVSSLQVAQKSQPKAKTTRKRVTTPRSVVPTQVFYLKAVAPGNPPRAWLSFAKGNKTVTVVIGDRLRGYGKVTAIEPAFGYVSTSSGRTIRYHPEDR